MMTSLTDAMMNVFEQIIPVLFVLLVLGILALFCKKKSILMSKQILLIHQKEFFSLS